MEKVLNVTYTSSLTNLCKVNSSFDTGVLRICYTGKNRNNSYLSKETILKSIPSIYNCPIVCNYDRETDTLGGHDVDVVRNGDGSLQIINATTPVGVVPESARVWFEDVEEDDGTIHEYLYADVLLWKRQEAYKKIKTDGITAHSMEIKVNSGKSIDGIYHIEDFEFNAFALIGVTPCFESSALEMFTQNYFKEQLSEMMCDLKEVFTKVNTSNEDDNINSHNYSTEGGKKVLEDKMKLAHEYGIDVETLDFSINDFTIEELTEKFESMKIDNEEADTGEFALTSNLLDELIRMLETEKIVRDWGECSRYCYVDCDMEVKEVYCWDRNDWLLYGLAFTVDGDSITIDFASAKRKKYVIADFEGGEQASPIAPVFEMIEGKLKEYASVEEKFTAASSAIASMETELAELRQFKTDTENAVAKNKRDELFSQFEDLNGIDAFEELREKGAKYSLETLEEKCFAIRGRNGTEFKFSEKNKPPKLKVEKPDLSEEPYGGLFVKYGKTNLN